MLGCGDWSTLGNCLAGMKGGEYFLRTAYEETNKSIVDGIIQMGMFSGFGALAFIYLRNNYQSK